MNFHQKNEFMCYDLRIVLKDKKRFYLDFNKLIKLMDDIYKDDTTMKLVPIIKKGTLEEMLALDPKYISVVCTYFNLKQIDNSYSEGFVIRTDTEAIFGNNKRLIFKYKNKDFSETCRVTKTNKDLKDSKVLTPQQLCTEEAKCYVTDNRYDNVFSKLSEEEQKDKKIIIENIYNDIIQDLLDDHKNDNDNIIINSNINSKSIKSLIAGFVIKKMKK